MHMAEDQKSTHSKLHGVKRQSSAFCGVYDYQTTPFTVTPMPHSSNARQLCSTSSSLSSHRCCCERLSSLRSRPHSSSRAKRTRRVKMGDLQEIKQALTLVKMQIDGLLDNLDRMDRKLQLSTVSASPLSHDDRLEESLSHSIASSQSPQQSSPSPDCRIYRDIPKLGEASDEHTLSTQLL